MTYQRLAYDDPATTAEMASDCRAAEAALRLPRRSTPAERTVRAAGGPVPSIRFEDYPRDVKKPTIAVSDAAARLGASLHLHLD
jgi:hypothetical protein